VWASLYVIYRELRFRDTFINSFDVTNEGTLHISANKKWLSLHPVVLSMVAALGMKVGANNVYCEKLEATSKHYLERMGLFKLLGIDADTNVVEHDPSGRFIPITQVMNSTALSQFIQDTVPLLHLETQHAEPIK